MGKSWWCHLPGSGEEKEGMKKNQGGRGINKICKILKAEVELDSYSPTLRMLQEAWIKNRRIILQ